MITSLISLEEIGLLETGGGWSSHGIRSDFQTNRSAPLEEVPVLEGGL